MLEKKKKKTLNTHIEFKGLSLFGDKQPKPQKRSKEIIAAELLNRACGHIYIHEEGGNEIAT